MQFGGTQFDRLFTWFLFAAAVDFRTVVLHRILPIRAERVSPALAPQPEAGLFLIGRVGFCRMDYGPINAAVLVAALTRKD